QGHFSFTLSAATPTQYDLQAFEQSSSGVVGQSAPLSVLLDSRTLSQPTLQLFRDTGTPGDGVTSDADLLGYADPNTTVTIRDGDTVLGTVQTARYDGSFG